MKQQLSIARRVLIGLVVVTGLSGCETLTKVADYAALNTELGEIIFVRDYKAKRIRDKEEERQAKLQAEAAERRRRAEMSEEERRAEAVELARREAVAVRDNCGITGYPDIDYSAYGVMQEACRLGMRIHGFWVMEYAYDPRNRPIAIRAVNHSNSKPFPYNQLQNPLYEFLEMKCGRDGFPLVAFRGSSADENSLDLGRETRVRHKIEDGKHEYVDAQGRGKVATLYDGDALDFIGIIYGLKKIQIRLEPKIDYEFELTGVQDVVQHMSEICPSLDSTMRAKSVPPSEG